MNWKKIEKNRDWDLVLAPEKGLLTTGLRDLWEYLDLLILFIKRDIIITYKQTVFGPVWYFIQPLLTMLVYLVVFSNIARIPTDGIPPPLFYLAGIVIWNFFHECFMQTSDIFRLNAGIFSKVYFPRLVIPVSKVITALIQFLIQSCLLVLVLGYYIFSGAAVRPGPTLLLVPVLLLLSSGMAMGLGLMLSALTAKYRDLRFIVPTGVQLLMYATPIIYPLSMVPEHYRPLIAWNPMAHIVEAFKLAVLGDGTLSLISLSYTAAFTLAALFSGLIIFNRVERTFADTV